MFQLSTEGLETWAVEAVFTVVCMAIDDPECDQSAADDKQNGADRNAPDGRTGYLQQADYDDGARGSDHPGTDGAGEA